MTLSTPLVTLDEAYDYAATHPASGLWQLASEEQTEAAILYASRLVRTLPFNVDFTTIETSLAVRAAVCEWAIEIVRDPASLHSAPALVSERRVGDLSVKYRSTSRDFVPPLVRTYLANVLRPAASAAIVPR